MEIFLLTLDIYFAGVLSVSGLAKMDNISYFATILKQQQIFPKWSIPIISKTIPLIEVLLATALLVTFNNLYMIISFLVLITFLFFLLFNFLLMVSKRNVGCGCSGKVRKEKVDGVSITVSVIWLLLAVFHHWLALSLNPIQLEWRFWGGLIFIGWMLWLVWKINARHRIYRRFNRANR